MNRPTIKKILNDTALSESEKIDQIFAVYTASTSKLKTEDDLQKAVADAQKGLNVKETEPYKDLKTKLDDLQEKYDTDIAIKQKELDDLKAASETESILRKKRSLGEKLLLEKQVRKCDIDDFMLDILDYGAMELNDKEDDIKNKDNYIKPYQEKYAARFGITEIKGVQVATPPAGTDGEKNPWLKENRNLEEQIRIYKEDPAKATAMAKAAGVNL